MSDKFEWVVVYKKGRHDRDLHVFDRFESEKQANTWLNFLQPVQRLNFVVKKERSGNG